MDRTTVPSPMGRGSLLPFAPEIVLPTIKKFERMELGMQEPFGFKATFNQTFPVEGSDHGWVSPWHFGIDQGPIMLMIENYRMGLLWRLMQRCPCPSSSSE